MTCTVISLDGDWLLATDPGNVGREQHWQAEPAPDARPIHVPSIIQEYFPAYHGVAWYWRTFTPPANPRGRTLLRFGAVDYLAEVWVNGVRVGGHEGGETPFVLDVTDALDATPGHTPALLAVRVLNPTNDPIDGVVLAQTPHRNKAVPHFVGGSYNSGGITESVGARRRSGRLAAAGEQGPLLRLQRLAVSQRVRRQSASAVRRSASQRHHGLGLLRPGDPTLYFC